MQVSRYTPSLLAPEDLEAIFVQRHKLAQTLVELVQESVVSSNKHYTLLIGPRGIGKTHLVALVYHRVMGIESIQDRLKITWLREEEWGISSFFDLLLRILRALQEADSGAKLEEMIETFYELSLEVAEKQALRLLHEYLGQKTLLLLMENLDEIFKGLGDEGQKKLRSLLQETGCCTIIATSQSLFNGVKLQTSPFYGFFRIRYLKEFSVDEAVNLLRKIAELESNPELMRFLTTAEGRSRVQAVHHLAGGNPRIHVVFSEFLTRESLDDLIDPFVQMLDDLTPDYQARMSWLSLQQRKIIEVLCSRRYAMPVKEIAQQCFATPQTTSSQLKDLRDKGYVVSETYGRLAFYELREPLMRICLSVKQVRGEPTKLIVDFLRTWYGRKKLEVMYDVLSIVRSEATKNDYTTALGIQNHSKLITVNQKDYLKQALQEEKEKEVDPRIAACEILVQNADRHSDDELFAAAQKLIELRGNDKDYFFMGIVLMNLGCTEETINNCDKSLEINQENDYAWVVKGWALADLKRDEEAIASFDRALEINQDDHFTWFVRGWELTKLKRYEEAIVSFDKALKIKPDCNTWFVRGVALIMLGCFEEALTDFNKALEINSDFYDVILFYRGILLGNLGHYEEAIASYDKALEINPHYPWLRQYRAELSFADQISRESLYEVENSLKRLPEAGEKESWSFNLGLNAIFQSFQSSEQWQRWLTKIIQLFEKYDYLSAVTQGLTQQLKELVSDMVSQTTAEAWRDTWQKLVGDRPKFQIPLRLLSATVEYKKAPNDPRVFLALPIEERKILYQLLDHPSVDLSP